MEVLSKRLYLLHFYTNESLQQFKLNLSYNCTFEQENLVLTGAFSSAELNLGIDSFNGMVTMEGKATFPETIFGKKLVPSNNRQVKKPGKMQYS